MARLDIPYWVKRAWKVQWRGDLKAAKALYDANRYAKLEARLASLIDVDRELLATKIGAPFSELPFVALMSPLARFVYAYACCWQNFWSDRRAARRSIRTMALAALSLRSFCALRMTVFLWAHLRTMCGGSRALLRIEAALHKSALKNAKRAPSGTPFFTNIILAAYPYALFVHGKKEPSADALITGTEHLLSHDPSDRSIFNVSMLYRAAFAGDINLTEVYAYKLKTNQSQGGLERYGLFAELMTLLPFALRGYTEYAADEIEKLLPRLFTCVEPIVRCEYQQVAAVILSLGGRHAKAAESLGASKVAAVAANAPHDVDRIGRLLDQADCHPADQDLARATLGGLVAELPGLVDRSLGNPTKIFVDTLLQTVAQRLTDTPVRLQTTPPESGDNSPTVYVEGVFAVFGAVPTERLEYIRVQLRHLRPLLQRFVEHHREILRGRAQSSDAAVGAVVRQVAHDIRSPLAALNLLSSKLESASEAHRILLRQATARIHDIAEELLKTGRDAVSQQKSSAAPAPEQDAFCVLSVMEDVLREKTAQFEPRIKCMLTAPEGAYGLFVAGPAGPIKRVLSNLLNNAVEAMEAGGTVVLRAQAAGNAHVILSVEDTGCGISPELLPTLMRRGESFGKEAGNGLGLAHAAQVVEQAGGRLSLRSEVGRGTTVDMELPRAQPPSWFVTRLDVDSNTRVFVLDDDAVHGVWDARFAGANLLHFSCADAFARWWKENGSTSDESRCLLLSDHELRASSKTGTQMIQDLGLEKMSIVVTSHHDDPQLLGVCERGGLRLLPKALAHCVPILAA